MTLHQPMKTYDPIPDRRSLLDAEPICVRTLIWYDRDRQESEWLCRCGCRFVARTAEGAREHVAYRHGVWLPSCPSCNPPLDATLLAGHRPPVFHDTGYFHAPYVPRARKLTEGLLTARGVE